MTDRTATSLEMRYRRLLRVYPSGHRAAYEEEMVGVLMSGAEPSRRFPSPGDALDLLRAGLTARLGHSFHTQRGTGWRDAAAVTGLFAALLLAGAAAATMLNGLELWSRGEPMRAFGVVGMQLVDPALRVLVWTMVVVAAVLGLRRAAAGLAAAGALVQFGVLAGWSLSEPWQGLRMTAPLALTLLAVALFAVAVPGRPVRAVLGRRGLALVAVAIAVRLGYWALTWNQLLVDVPFDTSLALLWLTVAVLAAAALGAAPRVRARIAVLSLVVLAVPATFEIYWEVFGWTFLAGLTPQVVAGVIAATALTPLAALAAGVTLLWAGESFVARKHGHVRAHE